MDTNELWALSTENFNKWRSENDLLKKFMLFSETLPQFKQWLEEYTFTVEFLASIPNPGNFFSGEYEKLFIHSKEGTDHHFFISIESSTSEKKLMETAKTSASSYIRFTPYFLWAKRKLKTKKIVPTKYNGEHDTFRYIGGTAPDVPDMCSSSFSPGFSLLKLGPKKITSNYWIQGMNFDFTNLDFLEIEGKYHNNGQIDIHYASFRNVLIKGANLNFITFYECYIENLKIEDSHLQSINFYKGELYGLNCQNSEIYGMYLDRPALSRVHLNRTQLRNVTYTPELHTSSGKSNGCEIIEENFKSLRMAYQDFGQRSEASKAYFKERTYEQKKLVHSAWETLYYNKFSLKRLSRYSKLLSVVPKIIGNFFSNAVWGYGERPGLVFFTSLSIILLYSLAYYCSSIASIHHNFINSIYLSTITFTTLGYGDITPKDDDLFKIVVGTEAILGAFLMGLFVAAYANKSRY